MAYFIPFDTAWKNAYEKGISLYDLFPVNVTGIVTGNDKSSHCAFQKRTCKRMDIVRNGTDEKDVLDLWGKFGRGQTADKIQKDVLSNGVITPISFALLMIVGHTILEHLADGFFGHARKNYGTFVSDTNLSYWSEYWNYFL